MGEIQQSDWIWRNTFFRCTALMQRSDGRAQAAGTVASVPQQAAALPGGNGGVCNGASLGAGAACAGPRCAADTSAVRESLLKRNKNDAADAEAIWEAVVRPTMRSYPLRRQTSRLLCCFTGVGSDWSPTPHAGRYVASASGGVWNCCPAGLTERRQADCHHPQ
jgi:hypothetical protein